MKNKIKTAIGILMMITAMSFSENASVFFVYIVAAALHELGHLLAAKVLKIKIRQIYFDFSGVRISVDNSITSYRSEILLALAGPIANIISSTIVLFFLRSKNVILEEVIVATQAFLLTGRQNVCGVCGFYIFASYIQALINMIPIKSFDGGRVLYCIISMAINEHTAHRIIALTSGVFAFILWTASLYLMLKVSAGLGIFVFSASIFMLMLTNSDDVDKDKIV